MKASRFNLFKFNRAVDNCIEQAVKDGLMERLPNGNLKITEKGQEKLAEMQKQKQ